MQTAPKYVFTTSISHPNLNVEIHHSADRVDNFHVLSAEVMARIPDVLLYLQSVSETIDRHPLLAEMPTDVRNDLLILARAEYVKFAGDGYLSNAKWLIHRVVEAVEHRPEGAITVEDLNYMVEMLQRAADRLREPGYHTSVVATS